MDARNPLNLVPLSSIHLNSRLTAHYDYGPRPQYGSKMLNGTIVLPRKLTSAHALHLGHNRPLRGIQMVARARSCLANSHFTGRRRTGNVVWTVTNDSSQVWWVDIGENPSSIACFGASWWSTESCYNAGKVASLVSFPSWRSTCQVRFTRRVT